MESPLLYNLTSNTKYYKYVKSIIFFPKIQSGPKTPEGVTSSTNVAPIVPQIIISAAGHTILPTPPLQQSPMSHLQMQQNVQAHSTQASITQSNDTSSAVRQLITHHYQHSSHLCVCLYYAFYLCICLFVFYLSVYTFSIYASVYMFSTYLYIFIHNNL